MKRTSTRVGLLLTMACAASVSALQIASAEIMVQYNFNGNPNGTLSPSTTSGNLAGAFNIQTVGGVMNQGFSSGQSNGGSSDPATPSPPDFGWQTDTYPAQGTANKTAGIELAINTTNFTVGVFSFDLRTSNSSSKNYVVRYSLDGTNFTDAIAFTGATNGDGWTNNNTFDFSSIAGASNNANFKIRVVSMFAGTTSSYQGAAATTSYAGGTYRWDMVTLNGTYTPPTFTATTLTWNSGSGSWDTLATNKPWLNPAIAASEFHQNSGQGDNVIFNNPTAGSVITVDAGGVTPNSITVTNSGTLAFAGGVIGGSGGLIKTGAGKLIFATTNSFNGGGAAGTGSSITGGSVETRADSGLGQGKMILDNTTWNSTTAAQTANLINLTLANAVVIDTTTDLTITGGLLGSGTLTKQGAGRFTLNSAGGNTGDVSVTQGIVRITAMNALGGDSTLSLPGANLNLGSGTTLEIKAIGNNSASRTWAPGNVTLNGATIERLQITPGLGNGPSNSDSEVSAYGAGSAGTFTGSIMTVAGNSIIRNNETRTAEISGANADNAMVIRMPILITAGGTLTLDAINDQVSTPGGTASGNIGNTATALRAKGSAFWQQDSVTLAAGATLAMTGVGEKRIGASSIGKPIIGMGTSASDSVFKADKRTYLTDQADLVIPIPDGVNTHLMVFGSGLGGLRVEGPMNANYAATNPEAGFFELNPDISETTFGNVYTILSPNRIHGLSGFANEPQYTADLQPLTTRGGTLTIAATDASGATGTLNDGPTSATPVKIGFDNTATSGDLVYQLGDAGAPSPALANFGGLVVKRTNASAVTVKLLSNLSLNGNGSLTSLDHRGGTLDLGGKTLTIPGAASVTQGTLASTGGSGSATAATLDKSTAGTYEIANGAMLTIAGATALTAGTINVQSGGTLNLASTTGSGAALLNSGTLTISGNSNLGQNQIAADTAGTTIAGTLQILANGNLTAGRLRQSNLSIGDAATTTGAKIKIVESSPTYAEHPDRPAGNNFFVSVVNDINIYRADTSSPFVGTLDITNNDVIIDYGIGNGNAMLAKIEAMVKSAYNSGSWTGPGITSSIAAANPGLFTVAVADNNQLGGVALSNFDGVDTSSHKQILIKFTWVADINLDGLVNSNDAIAFATFYSEGLTGVHHQTDDLNYDGTVNFNDAILFSTAYNASLESLPEPASLGMLAIGTASLLMRRRRA